MSLSCVLFDNWNFVLVTLLHTIHIITCYHCAAVALRYKIQFEIDKCISFTETCVPMYGHVIQTEGCLPGADVAMLSLWSVSFLCLGAALPSYHSGFIFVLSAVLSYIFIEHIFLYRLKNDSTFPKFPPQNTINLHGSLGDGSSMVPVLPFLCSNIQILNPLQSLFILCRILGFLYQSVVWVERKTLERCGFSLIVTSAIIK